MAIDVPNSPKVYTTTYDNFKGVDYTNDATNIWRRRSPTGTNMLPDASGRPFKRYGWNILISNDDICLALHLNGYEAKAITAEDFNENKSGYYTLVSSEYVQCTDNDTFDPNATYYVPTMPEDRPVIQKCAWFELAGQDHIVVFTDRGVFFFANNSVTAYSVDGDCYTGYDRCFFFEGDGTSAFYIYGNYRVWRYNADFILEEVTDKLTVPTLLVSAEADGTGTFNQGYNLLGNLASIEYNNADLFTYWGTDGLEFSVNKSTFTSAHAKNYQQTYTYDGTNEKWKKEDSSDANFTTDGITVYSSPNDGDKIFVIHAYGVVLPNNVDISGQKDSVKVWNSHSTQFDTKMEIVTTGTPTTNPPQCRLHGDSITSRRENPQAFVTFNTSETFASLDGQDIIKVEFPTTRIVVSTIKIADVPALDMKPTPTLNGEAVT